MTPIQFRLDERAAGILVHPTSLPGPFESGDLGPAAHAFVDFLASCGLRWWQMLPLGPVGHGHSPYASTSVFAGSDVLVSLERLRDDGLLDPADSALAPVEASARCDFGASDTRREGALRRAFEKARGLEVERRKLAAFGEEFAFWLDDYATFAAVKRRLGDKPFFEWPEGLRRREQAALGSFAEAHAEEIAFEKFVQSRFWSDLRALVAYAHEKNVALMGDAPIYVAHDSAEVWAHPEIFQMGADGEPEHVAGVPPDAFSDEGQLWGNPLYDWGYLEKHGFGFWVARLQHQFRIFDAVRLDHFIGFSRYWAVARGEKSAKNGTFHPVPGDRLFEAVFRGLGPVQLVAEDLGIVTDEVRALRDRFRLPGMSVLQFSFSPGRHAETSRPHRFPVRTIVYTGTHDNDTTAGWIGSAPEDASEGARTQWQAERDFALKYLALDPASPPSALAWDLVRAAFASHAQTAIVPVQDLLGLGRDARMNRPGIAGGNWSFRLLPGQLDERLAAKVHDLAELYGRTSA
ncbi:MAG: 4-alpha-glucanotransferase [Myxococcales bacterium]|nr:4-alpha-glucanotransferase [Myxococcales bacterium]